MYLQTSSNSFSIAVSTEPCPAGQFNANGGNDPGCQLCEIGSYSGRTGATQCVTCTAGRTTLQRGSTQSSQCNTDVIDPTEGYMKFDMTYFYHSNAGGTFLDTHQHKTQEECMQFCKKSPGCKAFDAGGDTATYYGGGPNMGGGRQEVAQLGDCFVSFDTIDTIKRGDVGSVPQLELFQKVNTQTVKDVLFRKTPQSYIRESNDGGAYKDEHSPEACAQLCLNDFACVSFDAGQVEEDPEGVTRWQIEIDDCFLSYKRRSDVPITDFVYEPRLAQNGLDYFERITPMYLEITNFGGGNFGWNTNEDFAWDKTFRDAMPNNPIASSWITAIRFFYNNNYYCAQGFDNCTIPRPPLQARPTCPNEWSYQAEFIDRFPHLAARDQFQQGLVAALSGQFPQVALRVEEKTSDTGVGQGNGYITVNPAETVMAFGAPNYDTRFTEAYPVNVARTLQVNGRSVTVVRREATHCAAGYVSQSGYTPGCQMCPPDTFSNFGQTDCVECPLGMVSDAGSSIGTEKACRPAPNTLAQRLGPFRVGYEWFGWYSAFLGNGLPGHGQMRMRITAAAIDPGTGEIVLEVFASAHHGETCGPGCRDPGLTEFLMSGGVTTYDGQTTVNLNPGPYSGITDRNRNLFAPNYIATTVSVRNRNNVMTGVFGDGEITMYERCHSAEEQGDFQPGNLFVGTYSCYREGTAMDSPGVGNDPCSSGLEGNLPEKDIYRFQLTVTTRVGNAVGALVEFDWMDDSGVFQRGEYAVAGTYSNTTQAIVFNAETGAWNTPRNLRIPARQLSGRLSDDAEFFNAQLNANPNCVCNGTDVGGAGASCQRWPALPGIDTAMVDMSRAYCVVDVSCPDSSQIGQSNTWVANCNGAPDEYSSPANVFKTCTDVTLARVCSSASSNCAAGWLADPIQGRCHKSSAGASPFVENGVLVGPRSWADAQTFCESQTATLVSVHSAIENNFLMNPSFAGIMQDTPVPPNGMWIGLVTETQGQPTWNDNTSFSFTRIADQARTGNGYINRQGRWLYASDTGPMRDFTCWQMPVGAAGTCECIGLSDSTSSGGYCNFWDGRSSDAWCYVSNECRTGVKYPAVSSLARASCSYQAPAGGGNGNYTDSGGVSQECDIRCSSCNGPDATDCTTCTQGSPLFLLNGACVADCHEAGYYKDNTTQRCVQCSASDGQQVVSQCSEYVNTVCNADANAGCGAGQGPSDSSSAGGCCANCEVGVTYSGPFPAGEGTGNACLGVSTCGPGTENGADPTASSDRQCLSCTAFDGNYTTMTATFQANDGAVPGVVPTCENARRCPLGQGATSPPTITSNTVCANCPADASGQWFSPDGRPCQVPRGCSPGEQQTTAPTATTDRVCTACPSMQWSDGSRACRRYTGPCRPGFGETARPTPNSDRVCVACLAGRQWSDGSRLCQPYREPCAPGFGQPGRLNTGSDRVCNRCVPPASWNDGTVPGSPCQDVTQCSPGEEETTVPTETTNRVCVPTTTITTTAAVDSAASTEKDNTSDSNMMLIIVIIVFMFLFIGIAVVVALAVVKKAKNAAGRGDNRNNIAFENPLYENQGETHNPIQDEDATYAEPTTGGGYMDFPGAQEDEEDTGYMDVPGQDDDGGGTSGYMDVSPQVQVDDVDSEEDI